MSRPPVIVVQFIHIQGPLKGEIQEFAEGTITIGRHPSCHLRFPADLAVISRRHAEIVREGNRFKLVDHSTNGTFVNGKRVTEAILKSGDVLEFSEGGPKVSFLTEVRERAPEPAAPRFQPAPRPAAPEPPPPAPPREMPDAAPPPQRPAPEPRPPAAPAARPPAPGVPAEGTPQTAKVPLIVQYGPMLKSYREVPVTIGRHPRCQFAVDHPAVLDQHAMIFFANGQYWVRDLTGRRLVEINRQPVGHQAPLAQNDELALTPKGPSFRFLGQGRLAEEAPAAEDTPPAGTPGPSAEPRRPQTHPKEEPKGGVLSRFRKLID